jgi:type II secretory pathway predicted ATPase ExeA
MYKEFFGLQTYPFGVNPDPRFLCMTPHLKEVLACLAYGIRQRKGFVVMTGEVGTGKTTLLKALLSDLSTASVTTAFMFNPRLEPLDFLHFMMADFGIEVQARTKSQMLLQLNQWLLNRHRLGITAAVIIDEAQNLSLDLLEEVRLLTNLETTTEKLLQIVLSGQPELDAKLRLPETRQLRQRITLRCRTLPLTQADTHRYIAERLHIAGCDGGTVFTPEAVDAIYGYARGIPRVTNLLCEHALIVAYVEDVRPVPAAIVHEVATDFELGETAPAQELAQPEGMKI